MSVDKYKIVEYKLIAKLYEESINNEINKLLSLNEGWEVYGLPSLSKTSSGSTYIQAMVRKKKL